VAGLLKVSKSTSFGVYDLFFTTTVTIQNMHTATLYEIDYMRNVDPDQEQVCRARARASVCVCVCVCVDYARTYARAMERTMGGVCLLIAATTALVRQLRDVQLRAVPARPCGVAQPQEPVGP
jgi:hypothetical protein